MSGTKPIRVACFGFVFDPVAEAVIRRLAPPELALTFAERTEDLPGTTLADSDVWVPVAPVTEAMIAGAHRLRLIQKWGTGFEKIDTAAAARHGVAVAITAGANAVAVAEHAVALMLAVLRRVADADRAMRAGLWQPGALRPVMHGLHGKTVGIVGFGNIGRTVARMLRGFDVEILYFRRRGPDPDAGPGTRFAPLPELLARSDVVSLHCPDSAATRRMLDRERFAAMKPGAIVVNTARGSLIVEDDLIAALRSGRLRGAGLDVFEREPLQPGSPLRALDTVVLTPHVSGAVMDGIAPVAEHAFGNILRFMGGEPLGAGDVIVPAATERRGGGR